MCKVIVFAGTTEGRQLAQFLEKRQVPAHICVATEYGEQLLGENENLEISHERLNQEQIEELILKNNKPLVIDATHPYAAEVTKNIKAACENTGAEYLRVLRENQENADLGDCVYVETVEAAVDYLGKTTGNILATTGSKEAAKYTVLSDFENRVFLRVLSLPNVVEECSRLGFQGKNLLCMQGPFSKEFNIAMLRQLNCKYMVTKMSGKSGGFLEKLEAARACGCTLVVVGRPLKETGVSLQECKRILCRSFSLPSQAEISLVGIGMGNTDSLTKEAEKTIQEADLLIGASRMLESCEKKEQDIYVEYNSEKIASYIQEHPEYEKIAVVLSGDVGFHSGAKKLLAVLGNQVKVICGISSVAYFMSRIQKSWDDTVLTSNHGEEANLLSLIRQNKKVFSILGKNDSVSELAKKLLAYGMDEVVLYVGERLSYADEKIQKGTPETFADYEGDSLSVLYVENENYRQQSATHGIRDEEFLRDKVPMTKEEVRTVSLSKLRLFENSVCYDIGAGTDSVAIEMALRAYKGKVYAIEKKELAVELLKKNKEQFQADNLEIIEGLAPEAMKALEAPTHAFIGGSSGNMKEIMELLLEKNSKVRIVINCIALESVSEALECLKTLPVTDTEIVQMTVSKSKTVGRYHMMMGENPVYMLLWRQDAMTIPSVSYRKTSLRKKVLLQPLLYLTRLYFCLLYGGDFFHEFRYYFKSRRFIFFL